ncbi:Dabb family protein [uncultured Anaeromusa sp.]|uniref:Dabb family protein n=1 Tax=uncultured Anaeromusa sp. TaxID=673273 RepID=UPI0029C9945D|nr:Dabb family protein [uncultured Anaeromusa sp.]
MIRHMFISPIKEGATEEQVNDFINAMCLLPDKISEIIQMSVGKNLGLLGEMIAVASVADFENEKDWKAYMEHPEHLLLAKIAADIFDIPSSAIAQIQD